MAITLSRRHRVVLATTAILTGGAIAFGAMPAIANTETAASDLSTPTQHHAGQRGADGERVPPELRQDRRELAAAEESERAALRAGIQDKALAGDYGDRVQRMAERAVEAIAALPDDLRAEVEAMRALSGQDRREAAQAIIDGMRAGEYGADAQEAAERADDRLPDSSTRSELFRSLLSLTSGR